MTFADWAADTRQRLDTDPLPAALAASAREFYRGAVSRMLSRYYTGRDAPYRTTIADTPARFRVETATDVKRAHDLNGEAAVAKFLFDGDCSGRVFWDIGAYHGHYSVLAALQGGWPVTFEPDPLNRRRIETNAYLNGVDIDLRPIALSNSDGMADLGGPAGNELALGDTTGDSRSVPTRRGDGLDPAPDLVKLDVEGHEVAVLDGMQARLGCVERIAVEVHGGVSVGEVYQRLADAGLSVVVLETDRSQPHIGGYRT